MSAVLLTEIARIIAANHSAAYQHIYCETAYIRWYYIRIQNKKLRFTQNQRCMRNKNAALCRDALLQYISDLESHPDMLISRNAIQHGQTSVYEHSMTVAFHSLKAARRLNKIGKIGFNERDLARGAFLHDFFLYDWHNESYGNLHGFRHPKIALDNAKDRFDLTKGEEKIILCHMWPLTILAIPTSKEAWLVCAMDKYCSVLETVKRGKR
jgi:uncharacterized protein